MKILVIEDDASIREEVLDWLQFEGYDAVGAKNGRQGVAMALEQLPDLIVSDVIMPEMDGHRVLLELRTHPSTAFIPFIFLTAKTTRDDIRYGMELGADDYITKPFTREELLGAVTSRLRRLEMQRQHTTDQIAELRSTLTRTLSHELRTPLVSIMGYGELLGMDADTLTPERIRQMAHMIVQSGQRLYLLIENYLIYAHLEMTASDQAHRAVYESAELVAPDSIIAATCEQVAYNYQRRSDLVLDMNGYGSVRMSEIDLTKITQELVDNAFKFSGAETLVQVTVHVKDHHYCLHVSDHGRGMKPEDVARIGAYMQFDRAVYEQQGAGLGLTIVKRLAALYGGQVHVESTPGEGTTVSVLLLEVT